MKIRTLPTAGAVAAVATTLGAPGLASELLVVGECVTGATTASLGKCAGAASQQWTRQSNGEYVLKSNGKCLTAPSANNGTQLTLAACADTANQHWAVP